VKLFYFSFISDVTTALVCHLILFAFNCTVSFVKLCSEDVDENKQLRLII